MTMWVHWCTGSMPAQSVSLSCTGSLMLYLYSFTCLPYFLSVDLWLPAAALLCFCFPLPFLLSISTRHSSLCFVSHFLPLSLSVLLKLMLSSNMEAVLEATRVYGNLTQWKEVRDLVMQSKGVCVWGGGDLGGGLCLFPPRQPHLHPTGV